jgi:hypothetical protein
MAWRFARVCFRGDLDGPRVILCWETLYLFAGNKLTIILSYLSSFRIRVLDKALSLTCRCTSPCWCQQSVGREFRDIDCLCISAILSSTYDKLHADADNVPPYRGIQASRMDVRSRAVAVLTYGDGGSRFLCTDHHRNARRYDVQAFRSHPSTCDICPVEPHALNASLLILVLTLL